MKLRSNCCCTGQMGAEGGTPALTLLKNTLKSAFHLSRVNIYSFEIYRMTVHLTVHLTVYHLECPHKVQTTQTLTH